VLARTVEVRHASSKRSDKAILKRGGGEFDGLRRIWAVEAGRDVEAMITSERARTAKKKSDEFRIYTDTASMMTVPKLKDQVNWQHRQ
jgi:hypothetical protein